MLERLPSDLVFLLASRYLSVAEALRLRCCCSRLHAAIPADKLCRCHPALAPGYGTSWDVYENLFRSRCGISTIALNWQAGLALLVCSSSDGCGQCNWTDEVELTATIHATPSRGAFLLRFLEKQSTNRSGGNGFGRAQRYMLGSARGYKGIFYDSWQSSEGRADGAELIVSIHGNVLTVPATCGGHPVKVWRTTDLVRRDAVPEPLAIAPAGVAGLRTAWMALALFMKHAFR